MIIHYTQMSNAMNITKTAITLVLVIIMTTSVFAQDGYQHDEMSNTETIRQTDSIHFDIHSDTLWHKDIRNGRSKKVFGVAFDYYCDSRNTGATLVNIATAIIFNWWLNEWAWNSELYDDTHMAFTCTIGANVTNWLYVGSGPNIRTRPFNSGATFKARFSKGNNDGWFAEYNYDYNYAFKSKVWEGGHDIGVGFVEADETSTYLAIHIRIPSTTSKYFEHFFTERLFVSIGFMF